MKKIFFIGLAAAALLTACDPVQVEKDYSMDSYTPEQLADMVQFKQFSATDSVTPQEDGNWFTYTTNPTQNVVIYTLKKDGSENILSGTGSHASGSFFFRPGRGSDPNQTLYVRYVDANNDTVTAQKQVTVEVAAELTPEMRLLASNDYGSKKWVWDDTFRADQASWGNMGYLPGSGESFATEGNGIWWGMKPDAETISTQLQHATDGNGPKYAGGAYMTFNYDLGTVTSYTESGEKIASGSFDVPAATWFNGGRDGNNWSMGTLTTTAGSILWPYQINGKGFKPEAFEIMQLDGKHLKLIYAAPGTGSWSEATWWAFKAK